jgi:metallo-beta-lactamase family protein
MVKVTCFGAAGSVTGANFLIETAHGKKVVVDCGLFQGDKDLERRNGMGWGFDPREIKTLILTHAHIDHSGRIPKMVRDGFRGRIIASPPTVDLCEPMLLDAAHVQEMEAEWRSKKNRRRAKGSVEPLYTQEDAEESLRYLVPMERDKVFEVERGVKARLRNAGHILGSCAIEIWVEDEGSETKIVFSGDLGKQDQLIVKDPFEIAETDHLFIESTYGDRRHRRFDESKAEMLEAIRYAVSNNEKVIIPAFALERSQEVLYLLGEFSRAGDLPDVPIYLDSPLAIKATEVFRKNKEYFDEKARAIIEKGFDPLDMPNLKFTMTTQESMEINRLKGPAIVVSASGMCTAGRIQHHLKHNLWRDGASVIFLGFQAQGTTGRKIVEGAKAVSILGEKIAVKAKVWTIGGFSAHADQADLLRWIGGFAEKSRPRVFMIHGEPRSSEALAGKVRELFGLDVLVPKWREVIGLHPPGERARKLREPAVEGPRSEMMALAADLEKEIVRLRSRLDRPEGEIAEEDLKRLKAIREDLRGVVSG